MNTVILCIYKQPIFNVQVQLSVSTCLNRYVNIYKYKILIQVV